MLQKDSHRSDECVCRQGALTTGGHYVAHVRKGATWYLTDSYKKKGEVRPLGDGELLGGAGGQIFMLVYVKIPQPATPPNDEVASDHSELVEL